MAHVPLFLEILTGPDQGKTFPLESELLHIGRGADNTIVLSDPQLGDFHVSISQQPGQLSLYANVENQIRVGKNLIAGQQWVVVPPDAQIHLGGQTEVRVVSSPQSSTSETLYTGREILPVTERRVTPRKESKRQVARPVTTRSSVAAVQLGVDGRYPELALAAGLASQKNVDKPRESNPALLFTILAASCLSSAALLLVDFETTHVTADQDQAFARSKLAAFYGTDSAQLEPYQKLLRRASVEYSQGNRSQERLLLKQVLALLNSVDASAPENLNGLTGRQSGRGKSSDKELRALLELVLE